MGSYDIALSGLNSVTTALETVGNNISNASTDGYHAQRVELSAVESGTSDAGNGVEVAGITRLIDTVLEKEILTQQSSAAQVDREVSTLTTMETLFGEFSSDGTISTLTDDFFNALQDLSLYPDDSTYQLQFVSAAESLCDQLNSISSSLDSMKDTIALEAENTVEEINSLTEEIAALNLNIKNLSIADENTNSLLDQRDQLISELSELIGITVTESDDDVVNIMAGGYQLVCGITSNSLSFGYQDEDTIGISQGNSTNYQSSVTGGTLGGLLSSYNEIVTDVEDDLDTLAQSIITAFNEIHVQGCSSDGSFESLTGWYNSDTTSALEDLGLSIEDGSFYIRITDENGDVVRTEIDVDVSSDSLQDVCDTINNSTSGVTASIVSGQLKIVADDGYTFDFMPAPIADTDASTASVGTDLSETATTSSVSVSGTSYTGSSDETYTYSITAGGTVGTDSMTITVTDSGGSTVETLSLDSSYTAGDEIETSTGITLSFDAGDLTTGDSFTVDAVADTYSTSTVTPTVSGTYSGDSNDTLTVTITDGGSVGNDTVTVEITNSSGEVVATLDLGSGYVAGDEFDLGNGLSIAFDTGDLTSGESFTIEALADTDTSGFLSAVGINTFFNGNSAGNISVAERFTDDVSQIATALTTDYTDNENALRLTDLNDAELSGLEDQSITDYYYTMVTLLGQDLESKETRSENLANTLESLEDQQSEISGVDVNEESALLLVYEQMYQAIATYLSTTNDMLTMLANLVG